MPCPSHPPWLHHSNDIWRREQVTKLLIMQFSPTSYYFVTLRSNYSPQHPVLKYPTFKTIAKIVVLYILIFIFLESRQRVLNWMVSSITLVNVTLILSLIKCWSVSLLLPSRVRLSGLCPCRTD
jgi:hypothetical protein